MELIYKARVPPRRRKFSLQISCENYTMGSVPHNTRLAVVQGIEQRSRVKSDVDWVVTKSPIAESFRSNFISQNDGTNAPSFCHIKICPKMWRWPHRFSKQSRRDKRTSGDTSQLRTSRFFFETRSNCTTRFLQQGKPSII